MIEKINDQTHEGGPSIDMNGQTEALGVVLLEAMASGTPVIGSNVGGIPDIIHNNYNGFLVMERSPEELSAKIIELLSDRDTANNFRSNGLKTINEKFRWDKIGEMFYLINQSLLDDKTRNL